MGVAEDIFAKRSVEDGALQVFLHVAEAFGLGIGVRVEQGLGARRGAGAARPEAGAGHFVAIGLAGDTVGQAGNAAGMLGRLMAGEAGDGEVEAAPEEMDRAGLAAKTGAEAIEHRHDPRQGVVQPAGAVALIIARRMIVCEADRFGDLVGLAVEGRGQTVPFEHRDQPRVQLGDGLALERQEILAAVADAQGHAVAAEVERQSEGAALAGGGREDGKAAGARPERRMPAMVEPGRMRDAQLAEHLADQM